MTNRGTIHGLRHDPALERVDHPVRTMGDHDVYVNSTDRRVYTTGPAFTAPRNVYLPYARSVSPGTPITVSDAASASNGLNLVQIVAAQGDTVDLVTSLTLSTLGGATQEFVSDGSTGWATSNRYVVTLPIAAGGTGQTTAVAAFDALSPVSARGDLIVRDASNNVRLPKGSSGQFLKQGANDPAWTSVVASDIGNSYQSVGNDVAITAPTNPTALTTLLGATKSFPTVAVGDTIEFIASGTYTNSQNSSTFRLNLLLAGATIFDYTTPALSTSANARRWFFRVAMVIKTTGASGRFEGGGLFLCSPGSTNTFVGLATVAGAAGGDLAVWAADTSSFDLSAAGAIDLKTLIGTSSSTATVALRSFKINQFQA